MLRAIYGLTHTNFDENVLNYMVEAVGFEPTTLWLKARYSSRLSYTSIFCFAALRRALLLLRCDPAFRNSANRTKQLRSRTIGFRFILRPFSS